MQWIILTVTEVDHHRTITPPTDTIFRVDTIQAVSANRDGTTDIEVLRVPHYESVARLHVVTVAQSLPYIWEKLNYRPA